MATPGTWPPSSNRDLPHRQHRVGERRHEQADRELAGAVPQEGLHDARRELPHGQLDHHHRDRQHQGRQRDHRDGDRRQDPERRVRPSREPPGDQLEVRGTVDPHRHDRDHHARQHAHHRDEPQAATSTSGGGPTHGTDLPKGGPTQPSPGPGMKPTPEGRSVAAHPPDERRRACRLPGVHPTCGCARESDKRCTLLVAAAVSGAIRAPIALSAMTIDFLTIGLRRPPPDQRAPGRRRTGHPLGACREGEAPKSANAPRLTNSSGRRDHFATFGQACGTRSNRLKQTCRRSPSCRSLDTIGSTASSSHDLAPVAGVRIGFLGPRLG